MERRFIVRLTGRPNRIIRYLSCRIFFLTFTLSLFPLPFPLTSSKPLFLSLSLFLFIFYNSLFFYVLFSLRNLEKRVFCQRPISHENSPNFCLDWTKYYLIIFLFSNNIFLWFSFFFFFLSLVVSSIRV